MLRIPSLESLVRSDAHMLVLGAGVLMPASNCIIISCLLPAACMQLMHTQNKTNEYLCWADDPCAVYLFWCISCHAPGIETGRQ